MFEEVTTSSYDQASTNAESPAGWIEGEGLSGAAGSRRHPQGQSGSGAVTVPHKYELIVFWSAEDAAFVVDVPELPGCMAHGATPPDAVAAAQEAIELWLEAATAAGRPIPEPKGRRLLYA
jgi:predicted RNase H-like HicB family nuclease